VVVRLSIFALAVAVIVGGRLGFVAWQREDDRKACIENLRMIEDWKENWSIINKPPKGARPTRGDLIGSLTSLNITPKPLQPTQADLLGVLSTGYLRAFPKCPARGEYIIGAIGTPPTCTLAKSDGHHL
jgi:hypothetical protein